jgi:4'-phosphopantetheinyl transferase
MLDDYGIDVWRADLEVHSSELNRLQDTLSPDELDRAAGFHFVKDRRRFIAGRGILRDILARYLDRLPAELHFSYSSHGKPSLAQHHNPEDLRFNLAHSGSLALYAVARLRDVGIDIERIEPKFAEDGIAERFFSRNEVTKFRSLPTSARPQAFFNCWTRKEAYVKARGAGLQIALDSFEVSLASGEQPGFLSEGEFDWSLEGFAPASDYVAAIAVKGHDWRPRFWQWRIPPAG